MRKAIFEDILYWCGMQDIMINPQQSTALILALAAMFSIVICSLVGPISIAGVKPQLRNFVL